MRVFQWIRGRFSHRAINPALASFRREGRCFLERKPRLDSELINFSLVRHKCMWVFFLFFFSFLTLNLTINRRTSVFTHAKMCASPSTLFSLIFDDKRLYMYFGAYSFPNVIVFQFAKLLMWSYPQFWQSDKSILRIFFSFLTFPSILLLFHDYWLRK